MLKASAKRIDIRVIAGFTLLALISIASAADDGRVLSPAEVTVDHLQALSASSNGTMEIYYDYMDNGVLGGGKLTVETPCAAVQMLSTLQSNDSYTLIDNGPVANRIDLVCVGDGYTADQMDLYWQHVQSVIDAFFQEPPLNRYASFFNVHVVEVISHQSGVDEPDNGIYRDTALDMGFNCNGIARLLCVDYSKAWAAASHAPATDLVIVLANTTRYGGAGYPQLSTLSGGNGAAVEVALHEFGHSFAGLADEYHYGDGTVYTGSERGEANVSILTAAQQTAGLRKWYRWLDLPEVNTFEGAYYMQYGIYRPVDNSKMKVLDYPFGPVNSEQFVFSVYDEISPIDHASSTPTGMRPADSTLTVDCQQPVPDTLEVTWQIEGVTVVGADRRTFCPADHPGYLIPNTVQTVTVSVTDQTDLVRDESRRLAMRDQRQWQVWQASADVVPNGAVDLFDLMAMADGWLSNDPGCDVAPPGGDGIVDLQDFSVLAGQWMKP